MGTGGFTTLFFGVRQGGHGGGQGKGEDNEVAWNHGVVRGGGGMVEQSRWQPDSCFTVRGGTWGGKKYGRWQNKGNPVLTGAPQPVT